MKKEKEKTAFYERIQELNAIIADPEQLKHHYQIWVDENERQVKDSMSAWHAINNRYVRALAFRHLLPSIKADSMYLLNYVYCEAHYDRLLRYLKKKFNVQ